MRPLKSIGMDSQVFPFRVNISLVLNRSMLSYVRLLNRKVVSAGFDEIDFTKGPLPIPHITLLMGDVLSPKEYALLLRGVKECARGLRPFSYYLGMPYLRKPSRHYVFVDTLPRSHFARMRKRLYDAVNASIDCEHHGGANNVSHITIGYSATPYPYLDRLRAVYRDVRGVARSIQVCEVGRRGTCIKRLKYFRIGS